jgi:acetoin utilization deacetylase AcuC-like enzyme
MRCFYHPGYFFPLPAEHPFPMDKFWRAEALVRAAGHPEVSIETVDPIAEGPLQRVHHADYLERIRTGALDRGELVRLGLPAGEALLHRSRLEVGGTVAAAHAAAAEGVACNLAGGTHHAFADRGLGYCVLNDVAVAIRDRQAITGPHRILVIDTDAHQGNGTNHVFQGDDQVFTYSIHVGRNYPAVKIPGSLDVELSRYATGDAYLAQLAATLPAAVARFDPEFVFWIAGADVHRDDRFGQLRLTDDDIAARDSLVLDLVLARAQPLVVLYGGGYNRDREHTARLHAATVLRTAEAIARRRHGAG